MLNRCGEIDGHGTRGVAIVDDVGIEVVVIDVGADGGAVRSAIPYTGCGREMEMPVLERLRRRGRRFGRSILIGVSSFQPLRGLSVND